MPAGEVQLFAVDDIEQNPVFFPHVNGQWTYQNFERYFDEYAAWHQSLYAGAGKDKLLGEDAPSYLPSQRAIDRIATYLPDAKLIVILRDPVDRLYSQYWHWVRTYRAIFTLEDTIRFSPGNLLQRSYYEAQLRYCFERLPREQVHVVLFEEFVRDQERITKELLSFLGLSYRPEEVRTSSHANPSLHPRSLSLALLRNRLFREVYGRRYHRTMPRMPEVPVQSRLQRAGIWLANRVNPATKKRPAPMDPHTRAFLAELLYERNAGLPDLLGRDLSAYWPTFQR